MNLERDLFEMSPEAEAAADAKALADIAADKGVPHEKVVARLKTWGTPQEGPACATSQQEITRGYVRHRPESNHDIREVISVRVTVETITRA